MTTTSRIPTAGRPLAALAAVLAVGVAAAGCGSSDDAPLGGAEHTAAQVTRHFRAVTGDGLTIDHRGAAADLVTLSDAPARTGPRLSERYGYFTISVIHDDDIADRFTRTPGGGEIEPDARGIRWREGPSGWAATKLYGNVALSWVADAHAVDARFRRLDRVLSTLGRPAAAVRAHLPATDRPCAGRGMTSPAPPRAPAATSAGAS